MVAYILLVCLIIAGALIERKKMALEHGGDDSYLNLEQWSHQWNAELSNPNLPILVVHVDPECLICDLQLGEIASLSMVNIVLVTTQEPSRLHELASHHQWMGHTPIIKRLELRDLENVLSTSATPYMVIINHGKVVYQQKGLLNAEDIKGFL